MKTSELKAADEIHRRDLRSPAYLFFWLVQWPGHRIALHRLKKNTA